MKQFLTLGILLAAMTPPALSADALYHETFGANSSAGSFDIVAIERPRIMEKAAKYLKEEPVTVTASHCERSQGGKHDFFSEGDYWWPDPQNPDGPYIQRDGLSNTNNFVEHRHAMIRLSEIIGTMASAYV